MSKSTRVAETSWNVATTAVMLCLSVVGTVAVGFYLYTHPDTWWWLMALCGYTCGASNLALLASMNDALGKHIEALEALDG